MPPSLSTACREGPCPLCGLRGHRSGLRRMAGKPAELPLDAVSCSGWSVLVILPGKAACGTGVGMWVQGALQNIVAQTQSAALAPGGRSFQETPWLPVGAFAQPQVPAAAWEFNTAASPGWFWGTVGPLQPRHAQKAPLAADGMLRHR